MTTFRAWGTLSALAKRGVSAAAVPTSVIDAR
jgi:hypothetical protein